MFRDTLPSDYEDPQITGTDPGTTGAVISLCAGETDYFSGNTLCGGIDRLDPGETVTVTYTAKLKPDVLFSKEIVNTATFETSSLPRDQGTGDAAPGPSGTETGERNGSGGGPNDLYGSSQATVTVSEPGISKNTKNPRPYYAIGENAIFQIIAGVPAGAINRFVITDQLPPGLSFAEGTLAVTLPPGAAASNIPQESNPGFFSHDAGNGRIVFDFGLLTVPAAGNIIIEYEATVDNVPDNQDGLLLVNTAVLDFEDPNHAGETRRIGPASNPTPVRVGEPNLEMTKVTTAGAAGADAGDTVSWSVRISNTGNTTAYQVDWRDVLPAGLHGISNPAVTPSGSGNVYINNTTTPLSNSHLEVGTTTNADDTIGFVQTFQIDAGTTLTVTFDCTLMNTVTPGMTLNNVTHAGYTSLPDGGRSNGSGPGHVDDDENDDSQLNNYEESAGQSITVSAAIAIDKTVDRTLFTIGEDVEFTIRISLIEGTTPALKLYDTLPDGLSYVGHQINAGHLGITFGNIDFNRRQGIGQSVWFDFGDVVNQDNPDSTDDYIDVKITARVDNTADIQSGTVLRNGEQAEDSFTYLEYGTTPLRMDFDHDDGESGIQGIPIGIIEPDLNINKIAVPASQALGDLVTFQVTVSHTVVSTADAYDLAIADTLPDGLTYVSSSLPPAAVTVNGQNLAFAHSGITRGNGPWQFSYTVRVDEDTPAGAALENHADMTWASLPGANGDPQNGRNGMDCPGLNDYCDSSRASVTTTIDASIDAMKTVDLTNDADNDLQVTPGDTLTYTVTLRNTDGNLGGVIFSDTLPPTTRYVGGSLASDKGAVDDSGAPVLWVAVGGMAAGETVTITFRVTVNPGTPDGTVISNQGIVDSDMTVPEPTDVDGIDQNGDQPTNITVGGADASSGFYVWKSVQWEDDLDNNNYISPGDTMTYRIHFQNTGRSPLDNVTFVDAIPAGLAYEAPFKETSSGTLNIDGSSVTLAGMNIAPNGIEHLSFRVTIDNPLTDISGDGNVHGESFSNQGTADSDETDPVLSDGNGDPADGNQPTVFFAADDPGSATPMLDVEKRWSLHADINGDGIVNPGDVLVYTIHIANVGAVIARDIRFSDPIPVHATLEKPAA